MLSTTSRMAVRRVASKLCTSRTNPTRTGLMGTDVVEPKDFRLLSARAISLADEVRRSLRSNSSSLTVKQKLMALDSISNILCSVADTAEMARNCHMDDSFRTAADEAFQTLHSYMSTLNTDSDLYSTLCAVAENTSALTEEERIFTLDMKREFESSGVNLGDDEKKHTSLVLQQKVAELESQYLQNTLEDAEPFLLGPIRNKHLLDSIKSYAEHFTSDVDAAPEQYALLPASRELINGLLMHVDEQEVRRSIWIESFLLVKKNISVLGSLITHRHSLAVELGFSSHAHRVLSQRIIKTPEACMTFLNSIAQEIQPKVEQEMELLLSLEKRSSSRLLPWDLLYFRHKFNEENVPIKADGSAHISAYLSLRGCIEGLKFVTKSLLGVRVEEMGIDATEAWGRGAGQDSHAGLSSGMLKLCLFDSSDNPLGTIYLDLYRRPHKLQQSAHITVRGGCVDHSRFLEHLSHREEGTPIRQLPIVVLLFQFSRSESGQPYLSLANLETLYHEWGHALHSLLSRTTFQHLSGTRGGADYAEIPSHLFEYFSRSSAIVQQWAVHVETGHRIPSGLLEETLQRSELFAHIEMQSQLLYSAADQIIFGSSVAVSAQKNGTDAFWIAMEEISKWQTLHSNIPVINYSEGKPIVAIQPLSHTHFINYGGEYYSYLFAKQKAKAIWNRHFIDDPLSAKSGKLIWDRMLALGSAKDPSDILEDVLR